MVITDDPLEGQKVLDVHLLSQETLCRAIAYRCPLPTGGVGEISSSSDAGDEWLQPLLREARQRLLVEVGDADSKESAVPSRSEAKELLHCIFSAELPTRLLTCLHEIAFEARKEAMHLFAAITTAGCDADLGLEGKIVEYVVGAPHIAQMLVQGCGDKEVTMYCSDMLRNLLRHSSLVSFLLEELGAVDRLLEFARSHDIEVSTEAFKTLRDLLLKHSQCTLKYLDNHYEGFFGQVHELLNEEYWVQRPALSFLREVLSCNDFTDVQRRYTSNERFLQIHMNLLRDESKYIQLDAFRIFKLFLANSGSLRVQQIISRNRPKLIKLLESLSVIDKDIEIVIDVLDGIPLPEATRRANAKAAAATPKVAKVLA